MTPATALYVLQVMNMIPSLIATGQSVMALAQQSRTAIENMIMEKRDPTPDEWNALNANIATLRTQLHTEVKPS